VKLKDLLTSLDILECTADLERDIGSVCYDSRKAQPDGLFVAVRGFQTDGHKYIPAAQKLGACAAVVDYVPEGITIPYVRVENSRRALAVIASNWFGHPERKAMILGVTGTNGKTTVTNLLKFILEDHGRKCGLIGTNGNMIGERFMPTERTTPESFELYKLFGEMVDEGCDTIIMEVSSHSLALDRVYGVTFEAAAFTNLTQDHLDFHHTMEEYAAAKAILFDRCRRSVVNCDDVWSPQMLRGSCPCHETFSTKDPEADYYASDIDLEIGGVRFTLHHHGAALPIRLAIPGMFSVYNALTALGMAHAAGIALPEAAASLSKAHGVKGRAQVVPTGTDYTVLLDYAHTPDGVENILTAARGFAKGRVVALFGCGGDRDKLKRPIMGELAGRLADFCIVTSDNPRSEEPMDIIRDILPGVEQTGCAHAVIEDRREAIRYALDQAQSGDVLVLMGKGHENYQEIKGVKHHLDEYEEVLAYFNRK
jgi:UDP-N-acetylmuramoyl-L-alanyl-D-glutamate--2,6-diaminopimelate ligase